MNKPQAALARVQMHSGQRPKNYLKATMWKDLQALAKWAEHLESEVERSRQRCNTLEVNLSRFAPGQPTAEDYYE